MEKFTVNTTIHLNNNKIPHSENTQTIIKIQYLYKRLLIKPIIFFSKWWAAGLTAVPPAPTSDGTPTFVI